MNRAPQAIIFRDVLDMLQNKLTLLQAKWIYHQLYSVMTITTLEYNIMYYNTGL